MATGLGVFACFFAVCVHAGRMFTHTELAKYDGADPNLPVYLAIGGMVFDVTPGAQMRLARALN
jgi:hypothetical protein